VNGPAPLFDLNPELDRDKLRRQFAADQRLQIKNLLTPETARTVHDILARQTQWGLAWQAAEDGPHGLKPEQLAKLPPAEKVAIGTKVTAAMQGRNYAFLYARYPMLDAYLEKWAEGSPQDLLLEHINDQPFLDLVREVTGIAELIKADAQATLYAPNQFLALHDDSQVAEGRRVAYVMNFCAEDWRADWGGYLMFYDDDGDVIAGFKPRFNALNLFLVPQSHNVTYVPPFAPVGRFAITGWFRDR
jgi:SM-20-related protein